MPKFKVTYIEETISKVERFEAEIEAPNEEEARKCEHWRMTKAPVKVGGAFGLVGTQRRTEKIDKLP